MRAWTNVLFLGLLVLSVADAHKHHAKHPAKKETETNSYTHFLELDTLGEEQGRTDSDLGDLTRVRGQIHAESGDLFNSDCACTTAEEVKQAESQCFPPSRMRVRQEAINNMRGLTKEEIHALIGKPSEVELVDIRDSSFSGIDGRDHVHSLGTPGGDFGEFLMALNEYEKATGKGLLQEETTALLHSWLNFENRNDEPMYLLSDEAAIYHLQQHLHTNGATGLVVGLDIENPKPELRKEILNDLAKSANHGCYFVKAVLDNPEAYYLRPELAHDLLKAYFETLWDKEAKANDGTPLYKKLNFVVVEGEPEEKAWINLRGNSHCESEFIAPVIAPKGDSKVYINHPHAAEVARAKLAHFFARHSADIGFTELFNHINHRGSKNMQILAETLASSLPYYTITIE